MPTRTDTNGPDCTLNNQNGKQRNTLEDVHIWHTIIAYGVKMTISYLYHGYHLGVQGQGHIRFFLHRVRKETRIRFADNKNNTVGRVPYIQTVQGVHI